MANDVPKAVPTPDITGVITIDDPALIKIKKQIDETVAAGREKSAEIDEVQKRIDELTNEEMEITGKIEPEDLVKKGDELRDQINVLIKELEEVADGIKKAKLDAIPTEIEKEHLSLNSKREKLEQQRNKLALKVQKFKDKLIPRLQKRVVSELEEFEDLLSAELVDGVIEVKKFSHLAEWKKRWQSNREDKA